MAQGLPWYPRHGVDGGSPTTEVATGPITVGVPNQEQNYSGKPAFRIPSAYLAMSSDRQSGVTSLRLDTRKAGSMWRSRDSAFFARSIRPASALDAMAMRNPICRFGFSCNTCSACEDASSYRPENK